MVCRETTPFFTNFDKNLPTLHVRGDPGSRASQNTPPDLHTEYTRHAPQNKQANTTNIPLIVHHSTHSSRIRILRILGILKF